MDIKELRITTGMAQKAFAEYFNIPVRTIQDWESGRRTPPDYVVELIKYKLSMEGIIVTKLFLEKNATLIEEYDKYDGSIYLGTNYYYLYNDVLYCSEYHDNKNRYTGSSRTYILVDKVRETLGEYNKLYFLNIGLSEEGCKKLKASI